MNKQLYNKLTGYQSASEEGRLYRKPLETVKARFHKKPSFF